MLVNSVQLGSYDNKCLNAKLYFTPPRHESSHDNRCFDAFLQLMVCFSSIYWSAAILQIVMLPSFHVRKDNFDAQCIFGEIQVLGLSLGKFLCNLFIMLIVWSLESGHRQGEGELSGVNFESGYMQGIMWITLLISSCFQTGYGYLSHTPTGKLVFTILEPCNISDYDIILVEIFIYWLEPWSRSRGSELNQR
jgi:uncharacterized membrane protein YwaF